MYDDPLLVANFLSNKETIPPHCNLNQGRLDCDQIASAAVVSYCTVFSDIAEGWGVLVNDPALVSP